jgi:hypothetical protein
MRPSYSAEGSRGFFDMAMLPSVALSQEPAFGSSQKMNNTYIDWTVEIFDDLCTNRHRDHDPQ